ncbi:MAG: hypothetical protein M3Y08_11930, partial [Fibrobacterota bacterium]|nr:hypothetical protein [Fibrobacterota bacterium]
WNCIRGMEGMGGKVTAGRNGALLNMVTKLAQANTYPRSSRKRSEGFKRESGQPFASMSVRNRLTLAT